MAPRTQHLEIVQPQNTHIETRVLRPSFRQPHEDSGTLNRAIVVNLQEPSPPQIPDS